MSAEKTYSECIEEIKNRLDILDVVQQHVILKKKGANYWGCCPFHNEKTPSFSINVQKGIFKCFGCGAGGDAFTFLEKINNQTFNEVIQDLAQRFGIELPHSKSGSKEFTEEKQKLKSLMKEACGYYHDNLFSSPDAQKAFEYLQKRGITKEIIDEYGLGYSNKDFDSLLKHFKSKYTPELMEKAGLVLKTEKGSIIDRFRNRIMIPVKDIDGSVIAFGARAVEAGQNPKYLNSPDTVLYNKSRILYGIDHAKDAVITEDSAVIMEGYFDVISAQAAGLKNAIASCGTALTVDHIRLIAKYSKSRKIYLAFDTDAAGLKASERSKEVIKKAFEGLGNIKMYDKTYSGLSDDKYTCEIRVIAPFDSKDPDEYIREYGIEQYKSYIKKAPLLIDFELEQVFKDYKPDLTPSEKLELIKKIMPLVEEIPDNIVQNEYIKLAAARINVDETALIREVNRSRNQLSLIKQDFTPIVTKSSNISEKAQKNLLSLFLVCGSNSEVSYLSENIKNVNFSSKNLNILKNAIDKTACEINNNVDVLVRSLYAQFAEDNELKDIITDIIYTAESFKGLSGSDFRTAVQENKAKIQQCSLENIKNEILSKSKKLNDDDAESLKSQIELLEIIKNRQKTGD